jgi:hypothetical protein
VHIPTIGEYSSAARRVCNASHVIGSKVCECPSQLFYFKVIRPLIKIIIKIENVKVNVKVITGSSPMSMVRIVAHGNLFKKNLNNIFSIFFQ